MFYEFKGYKPVVHPTAFVHPQAIVTGNVIIGRQVYIGPGCALRGDWGQIIVEDFCNVQENCTVHMFPGTTVRLQEKAHIGHGAVIHGATIGKNVLVGMNAVIMDRAVIEDESIVGALSFVKADAHFPKRSIIVGNPAKAVKTVSDEMLEWKDQGTQQYMQLPADCRESLKPCDPLTEVPDFYAEPMESNYKTWNETRIGEGEKSDAENQ